MEFNKSNCFNNENTINQNLIHYAGGIGEFDYDPNIWRIDDNHLAFKDIEVESLPENLQLPKGCIDTSCMFSHCKKLKDITPLQNWDTSNVTDISSMFYRCEKLTDITPLKNWDTSNVKKMSYMFSECYNLIDTYPLKNWNTSNVKYMLGMFSFCTNLIDITALQNWDTSKIINM